MAGGGGSTFGGDQHPDIKLDPFETDVDAYDIPQFVTQGLDRNVQNLALTDAERLTEDVPEWAVEIMRNSGGRLIGTGKYNYTREPQYTQGGRNNTFRDPDRTVEEELSQSFSYGTPANVDALQNTFIDLAAKLRGDPTRVEAKPTGYDPTFVGSSSEFINTGLLPQEQVVPGQEFSTTPGTTARDDLMVSPTTRGVHDVLEDEDEKTDVPYQMLATALASMGTDKGKPNQQAADISQLINSGLY